MKVIFTGDNSANHFYPIIAVAEELNNLIDKENLADTHMYFFSRKEFSKKLLYENGIIFKKVFSGRNKFSLTFLFGFLNTFLQVFNIFPDIIFSTGGNISYPVLLSAKILKIPVIIHESNSIPNETNKWAEKFAKAITVAYKQSIDFFEEKLKVIHVGQPIMQGFKKPISDGAHEFLQLEENTPILWIISGNTETKKMNRVIEEALPYLLEKYQVVHQTGKEDFEEISLLTDATLVDHNFKYRYHIFDRLNPLSMKMLAGISDVVIARAGSILFEIAHWRLASIIIPKSKSKDNYQIKNAYNYAREGACVVIEENNLTDQGLIFEINRIYNNKSVIEEMKRGAHNFALPEAGKKIAEEIVAISLKHEE